MLKSRLNRFDLETAEGLLLKCVQDVLLNQAFVSPGPHDIEELATVENHAEVCCPLATPSMFRVYRADYLF
jgi:hypothetical protein